MPFVDSFSALQALSNQKFRDFKQTFGDVGIITGELRPPRCYSLTAIVYPGGALLMLGGQAIFPFVQRLRV
jgi:hypothetical protein